MINGDIPCYAECETRPCKYNLYGFCMDNCPCDRQTNNEKENA